MHPSRPGDQQLDAALLNRWRLPVDDHGDKYSRGTVLVVGGSTTTPGAVMLAGMAALRVGAGRLQIATSVSAAPAVAVAVPESLVLPIDTDAGDTSTDLLDLIAGADAILLGSGLAPEPPPVALLRQVLQHSTPPAVVVVDAAGLAALSCVDAQVRGRCRGRLLLTPNRQEVDMLRTRRANDALAEPDDPEVIRQVAGAYGAVVTSFGTVCADDGRCWHTDAGHPSLGTSGSGDVLAGMAAGFAARTGDAAQAACWATLTHAATGARLGRQRGHLGFLARELIENAIDLTCDASSP